MSIQTELTRITNAKAAIKTAIEGKGVTVPDGTKLDALAALVESIEVGGSSGGGDIVLGEITITSNENVTLTDAFPARSQVPKAFFWFEKGTSFGDATHSKRRPLALIAARDDGGLTSDIAGTYKGAYIEASSGSNSTSANKLSATNMFNRSAAGSTGTYTNMIGNYKQGTLYFCVNNTRYGFIEGRTYVWGVIPWDE